MIHFTFVPQRVVENVDACLLGLQRLQTRALGFLLLQLLKAQACLGCREEGSASVGAQWRSEEKWPPRRLPYYELQHNMGVIESTVQKSDDGLRAKEQGPDETSNPQKLPISVSLVKTHIYSLQHHKHVHVHVHVHILL